MSEASEHQVELALPREMKARRYLRYGMVGYGGLFVVAYAVALVLTKPATLTSYQSKAESALAQHLSSVLTQGMIVASQLPSVVAHIGNMAPVATTTATGTSTTAHIPLIDDAPTLVPDISSPQRHLESLKNAAVDENPGNRVMAISGMAQMAQATADSSQHQQILDALRIAAQDGDPAVAAVGREALLQVESVHVVP